MYKEIHTKIIGSAHAQNLIPCPDGTFADPAIGCVETPAAIVSPESSLLNIILNFSEALMTFVAGIAVIVLIYGGIKYAMSIGNDVEIQKAKKIIIWGVFGLVIALLARFVAGFILGIVS